MDMSQDDFDALVHRLERESAHNPRAYQLRLGAFGVLGYLYVFAILLLLVSLVTGLIASLFFSKGLILVVKKLLIPVVVLIGLVARALWVRLELPEGLELRREAHPALFAAIEEMRAATQAPRVHDVLLRGDLNAAVVQIPRLGLFGWQRNFLLLGLPLMQLMSVAEFKAVLAHEFGHLSGAHGRFGAWIYRVRASWERIAATLKQEDHWGSFLFVPFFSWYAPRFAAWSFVQARRQEYEADQLAAEAGGASSIASGLARLAIQGEELHKSYWPGFLAGADREPEPNARPYLGLAHPDRRELPANATDRLASALDRNTSTADTHPCLRERIAALAVAPGLPAAVNQSAAEQLFGRALAALIDHFDTAWRNHVRSWWRERHAFVTDAHSRLAAFEGRTLDDEELAECARLTESAVGDGPALPLFEELLRRKPGYPPALFACGRIRLARGDEAGIGLIEEAMRHAPEAVMAGCEIIVGFLHEHGREAEAKPFVERYRERQAGEQRVYEERQSLRSTDTFVVHGMPEAELGTLVERLAGHDRVKRARLVRKQCRWSAEPLYAVGLELRTPWYRYVSADEGGDVAQELAQSGNWGMEVFFVPINRNNRAFRKIFRGIEGSLIYSR